MDTPLFSFEDHARRRQLVETYREGQITLGELIDAVQDIFTEALKRRENKPTLN